METTLAYIDDVTDRAVATRASNIDASAPERTKIREAANRRVAGFKVFDEAAERKMLDELIARKRAVVDKFLDDSQKARAKLSAAGVSPLAILPTKAWEMICDKTGLFRMAPDERGRVGISLNAFDDFPMPSGQHKTERRGYSPFTWEGNRASEVRDPLEATAKADWPAMLKRLFGGLVAPTISDVNEQARYSMSRMPTYATLLLPSPPDDVVATLLKVESAGIPMKVAAVADAIGFRETMTELRDRVTQHIIDEDERIRRLQYEPFIYTEHGTATAIVAQFGDFPIEKEIVDLVVNADDFLPDNVPVARIKAEAADDMRDAYMAQAEMITRMQNMQSRQNANLISQNPPWMTRSLLSLNDVFS